MRVLLIGGDILRQITKQTVPQPFLTEIACQYQLYTTIYRDVHAYMIYALMLQLGVNMLGLSMSAVALGMISFLFPIYYYRSGR